MHLLSIIIVLVIIFGLKAKLTLLIMQLNIIMSNIMASKLHVSWLLSVILIILI